MDDLEKLMEIRFAAHEREHVLLAESLTRARENVDSKLEGMNELRTQINAERGRFVERANFDLYKDNMEARQTILTNRIGALESRLTTMAAGAAFLLPIVIFLVNYFLPSSN